MGEGRAAMERVVDAGGSNICVGSGTYYLHKCRKSPGSKDTKLSVQDVLEEHSGQQELTWKGAKETGGPGQSTGGTGAVLCLRVTAFIPLTACTGR